MTKLSSAQAAALRFLTRDDLMFTIDGAPAAQIKIRTARPLVAAGLVKVERTAEQLAADAKAGGWVIAAITDKGRDAVA